MRFIVPLPASGAADVSVRLLAEAPQGPLGQSISMDNRPGGACMFGLQQVNQAPDARGTGAPPAKPAAPGSPPAAR